MIGFGSHEVEVENRLFEKWLEHCEETYTDIIIMKVDSEWLETIRLETARLYEEYRVGAHPERYSTFHYQIAHTASMIVVTVYWQHVYRRHPLSADGWAGMFNTTVMVFDRIRTSGLYR